MDLVVKVGLAQADRFFSKPSSTRLERTHDHRRLLLCLGPRRPASPSTWTTGGHKAWK